MQKIQITHWILIFNHQLLRICEFGLRGKAFPVRRNETDLIKTMWMKLVIFCGVLTAILYIFILWQTANLITTCCILINTLWIAPVLQHLSSMPLFSLSPLLFLVQHVVEVLSLLSDDVETDDAGPGENLKLRLKGIEEEEILPGFILCNAENLCHSGRTFDAQVSLRSCCRMKKKKKMGHKILCLRICAAIWVLSSLPEV